jgi:predicted metalloprotease with PDZ domain
MVPYAFPLMLEEPLWIEEGLATYVEPIARLEAGQIRAAQVWGDLVHGLPYGMPARGDEGLDYTHTWGRTYWGGALFCLLADVRIRRETHNRYGLRDALRAIVDAGGNIETSWPLMRTLAVGDKAIGVPILMRLYSEMKAAPVKPNLADLWNNLGIEVESNTVRFDDNSPWTSVRRAIADDLNHG